MMEIDRDADVTKKAKKVAVDIGNKEDEETENKTDNIRIAGLQGQPGGAQ